MYDRAPAAGYGEQVAVEPFGTADFFARCGKFCDGDARDAFAAACVDHNLARHDRDVLFTHRVDYWARRVRAWVDDGGDLGTGGVQRQGCFVRAVVVGEQHGTASGYYGVTMDVNRDCAGQHDAGAVVVGEDQWAFVGAGGEDDVFGAQVPEAFADGRRYFAGFREFLDGGRGVVVRVSEDGGV